VTVGDEVTDSVMDGLLFAVSLLELELEAGAESMAVDCVVVGCPTLEVTLVVSPVAVAPVAKGAGVVVSSSERSSSLSRPESIPESISSPSAASNVDPRPVGRA